MANPIRRGLSGSQVSDWQNNTVAGIPNIPEPSRASAWQRPTDWVDMPVLTGTEQKMYGVVAVMNDGANAIALKVTVSTGTYTVDWGDGVTDSGITSGTAKTHQYTYSTLSSTVTSRGYKTALVTVTTSGGNITAIDLQQQPSTYTFTAATSMNWLDIQISAPNMTTLTMGAATLIMRPAMLERFVLLSSSLTTYANQFNGCRALKVASVASSATVTATNSMFNVCYSLTVAPWFNTASVTDMNNMFAFCTALQTVPHYNTSAVTNVSSMFYGCGNLRTVPKFDLSAVVGSSSTNTGAENMFYNCTALVSVPDFNLSACKNFNYMFYNCQSLETAPNLTTTAALTMTNMFQLCASLKYVPTYDLTNCTTAANMFASCFSLARISLSNTSNVTTFSTMINSAWVSEVVGLNCSKVTTMLTSQNSLSSCVPTGLQINWDISNARFSSADLDAIYSGLYDSNAYTITNATWSGGIATYTTSVTNYITVGQRVTVTGMNPTGYNVTSALVTAVGSSTFSVAIAADPGTFVSGGTKSAGTARTITVTGNFGTTGDTTSIATNKGWTVTG